MSGRLVLLVILVNQVIDVSTMHIASERAERMSGASSAVVTNGAACPPENGTGSPVAPSILLQPSDLKHSRWQDAVSGSSKKLHLP